MVAVRNGKILSQMPLPVAGLMSDRPVEVVSGQIERLKEAWAELGCVFPSPYMTLSLTTLSVIPELRITDLGVLDTVNFRFVSPIIE